MNNMNTSLIQEFLIHSYISSVLNNKRKYYDLNNEEGDSFDGGWGIPTDLTIDDYKIIQIFKYDKGYELLELELFYQDKLYKECGYYV